jgi:rhodanese-related sulfurtransferase
MRWKQFFTPVKSLSAAKTRQFISERAPSEVTILDVRQPAEYETGHIPGAKLIPIPDLGARFSELDSSKPTVVY